MTGNSHSHKDKGQPHFTITDSMGREFVCRVYEEDELTKDSVSESVFDAPVEKNKGLRQDREDVSTRSRFIRKDEDDDRDDGSTLDEVGRPSFDENVEETHNVVNSMPPTIDDSKDAVDMTELIFTTTNIEEYLHGPQEARVVSSSVPKIRMDMDMKTFTQSLSNLEGLCAQLHMGWWSYEWCYNDKVTQFHVQVQANQMKDVLSVKDLMPEFVVQSISTIGIFTKRKIIVETMSKKLKTAKKHSSGNHYDYDDDDVDAKKHSSVNHYDYDDDDDDDVNADSVRNDKNNNVKTTNQQEVKNHDGDQHDDDDDESIISDVLVIESYENGDYCEEAGANRVAEVHMR